MTGKPGKEPTRTIPNHPTSGLYGVMSGSPLNPEITSSLTHAESEWQTQPLEDNDGMDGSSGVLKIQVTLEG